MSKSIIETLIKSMLAGMVVSFGCMAYLTFEDKTLASVIFTIGLFTIYTLNYKLFTGKVGYILEDKEIGKLGLTWVGNFIGTAIMAFLVSQTRIIDTTDIIKKAHYYSDLKIGDEFLSVFILGCFCGMMMYIAAQVYKQTKDTVNSIGGYVGMFLVVMGFLLLGFEHSVANMFYFTMAGAWTTNAVISLLVITAGNAVGSIFMYVLSNYKN